MVRTGTCSECGAEFEHRAPTGRVPFTCSPACFADRRRRQNSTPERRAYVQQWHQENVDRVRDNQRRWVERHPDRRKAASSAYTKRNRAKANEQIRRYRARQLATQVVQLTPDQIAQRMSMFAGCWICGTSGVPLEVDHVKPLSVGGPHILANLRPACRSCNARKGAKWPVPHLIAAAVGVQ